jgi:hypothetical protein
MRRTLEVRKELCSTSQVRNLSSVLHWLGDCDPSDPTAHAPWPCIQTTIMPRQHLFAHSEQTAAGPRPVAVDANLLGTRQAAIHFVHSVISSSQLTSRLDSQASASSASS